MLGLPSIVLNSTFDERTQTLEELLRRHRFLFLILPSS
jgi:hypothetical protein